MDNAIPGISQSIVSKETFSIALVSNYTDTETTTNPECTVYAETIIGQKKSNRVPNIPSSSIRTATFVSLLSFGSQLRLYAVSPNMEVCSAYGQ